MICFMRDFRERHGPLWLHLSNEELMWMLAAACSAGVLIGIVIVLMAIPIGGAA